MTWAETFDLRALIATVEALQARVQVLEDRADKNDEHVSELNFIQPAPMGGYVPRNRSSL